MAKMIFIKIVILVLRPIFYKSGLWPQDELFFVKIAVFLDYWSFNISFRTGLGALELKLAWISN